MNKKSLHKNPIFDQFVENNRTFKDHNFWDWLFKRDQEEIESSVNWRLFESNFQSTKWIIIMSNQKFNKQNDFEFQ